MDLLQAVILGIVQGLSEFLPISSSGHLVLVNHLLGIKETSIFFNISVHVGTLTAILLFFKREIKDLTFSFFKTFSSEKSNEDKINIKFAWLIIVGSVPTAIIGLFFSKHADRLFSSVALTGIMLIITGIIVGISFFVKKEGDKGSFPFWKSVIIGISQGLAIIPGISRSGTTIVTGQLLGIDRELAGRYSFLLSVPAIMGAELLEIVKNGFSVEMFSIEVITGTIVSFITGYFVLKYFMIIIKKGKFYLFAPYCFLVGLSVIFFIG